MKRVTVLVGALVALVALPSAATPGCDLGGLDDRCESWVTRFDHAPGHDNYGDDNAVAMAVDPAGHRIYVTSWSWEGASGYDIAVQSLDAATGTERWVGRHHAPLGRDDYPAGIAVHPDGDLVYVAGTEGITDTEADMVALAFDADTGDLRWRTSIGRPGPEFGLAIAAAPDGEQVFLVGSESPALGGRVLTVGLDARTGAPRWQERYEGAPASTDLVKAVAVTRDRLFVAATTYREDGNHDYLLLAYELAGPAREVEQMWDVILDGGSGLGDEIASIDVSLDGHRIFVTGTFNRPNTAPANRRDSDYGTAALDADTGERLWSATFGAGGGVDYPYAVVAAPDRDRVYVTGAVQSVPRYAFGTLAYDGTTGEQVWDARTDFPWGQAAVAMAVAPDGSRVYVTGQGATPYSGTATGAGQVLVGRADYVTVALDASGSQVWAARYSSSQTLPSFDLTAAITVSPDGDKVFVTGTTGNPVDPAYLQGTGNGWDAATLAYEA